MLDMVADNILVSSHPYISMDVYLEADHFICKHQKFNISFGMQHNYQARVPSLNLLALVLEPFAANHFPSKVNTWHH